MSNSLYLWLITLFKSKDKNRELRKFSAFKDLNSYELFLFNQIMHRREYQAGEMLFEERYPLELIYFINKGEVEVFGKLQPKGSRILKKHQYIGILDMYHEHIRSSSARAVVDSEVLAVSRIDFIRFLKTNPKTGVKILTNICTSFSKFIFDLVEEMEISA